MGAMEFSNSKVFNHRMEQVAIHCFQEPGRFSTHSEHIDERKTHPIERGVEYLLKKVRFFRAFGDSMG